MPATITITRASFSETDVLPVATFNSVTILSATVADATGNTEGVIRLAGDLTGTATAPQLANSGATAGIYGNTGLTVASITIDAKGRVTSISNRTLPDAAAGSKGVVQLAGDLTGTAAAPVLVTSGVTAGTYGQTGFNIPVLTIDAKGRVTGAIDRTLALPDASGGSKGLIQLAGDLTGTAAAPALTASGATAGTYGGAGLSLAVVTVDAKGRVTGIAERTLALTTANVTGLEAYNANGLAKALVRFNGNVNANLSGAYNLVSNVVTVQINGHGLRVGDSIFLDFTTGSGGIPTDDLYQVVSVPNANTFTVACVRANTSGNVTAVFYQILAAFNVHHVTKDNRGVAGSYWGNFTTALATDEFVMQLTGQTYPGSWQANVEENSLAGVSLNTTKGFGIYSANAPRRVNVTIY